MKRIFLMLLLTFVCSAYAWIPIEKIRYKPQGLHNRIIHNDVRDALVESLKHDVGTYPQDHVYCNAESTIIYAVRMLDPVVKIVVLKYLTTGTFRSDYGLSLMQDDFMIEIELREKIAEFECAMNDREQP